MKKLLRVLLVLFIAAGLMPMQVMAEETGETAETFEKPYDYSITVVYHACGGKFGTSLYGVSADRTSREAFATVSG